MFATFPETLLTARFGLRKQLSSFDREGYEENIKGSVIMVCEGDAFVDGSLEMDWQAGWEQGRMLGCDTQGRAISGLVVTGNLTVSGSVANCLPESGPFLWVQGNLHARHWLCGGAEMRVTGNVNLEEVFYHHGNVGVVNVGGNFTAHVMVQEGKTLSVAGQVNCSWVQSRAEQAKTGHSNAPFLPSESHFKRDVFFNDLHSWADVFDSLCHGNGVLREVANQPTGYSAEEWHAIIRTNPSRFANVPEPLVTDALCHVAVNSDGLLLKHVPAALLTPALCHAACLQTGEALVHVPETLKTRVLCLQAAKKGAHTKWIPKALLDEEMACTLVRRNGHAFSSLPLHLQSPRTVAAAFLSGNKDSVALDLQTEAAALIALDDGFEALHKIPGYVFTAPVYQKALLLYGRNPLWQSALDQHSPKEPLGNNTFLTTWACLLNATLCVTAIKNGDALYRLPRMHLSAAVCTQAFEHDPFNFTWIPQAHMTLAMCERAVNSPYGRALARVPRDWLTEAMCLGAVRANESALTMVPEVFCTQALYVEAVRHHPNALAHVPPEYHMNVLTQLLAQDPAHAERYHAKRAEVALARGEHRLVVVDCSAVIQYHPQSASAYLQRAHAHCVLNHWSSATNDVLKALELDPKLPWANNLLGVLCERAGCPDDLPNAMAAYTREVRLDAPSSRPLLNRAELYLHQGDVANARADVDAALRLTHADPWGLYLRGYCAARRGDLEAAQADLALALKRHTESKLTSEVQTGVAALPEAHSQSVLTDLERNERLVKAKTSVHRTPVDLVPYPDFHPCATAFPFNEAQAIRLPRTLAQWLDWVRERPKLIILLPKSQRSAELYNLAVAQSSALVFHVPRRFMTPALYTVAVTQEGMDIAHIPASHMSDAVARAIVEKDGLRLERLGTEWRGAEVCIAACRQNPGAWAFVPELMKLFVLQEVPGIAQAYKRFSTAPLWRRWVAKLAKVLGSHQY